MTPRRAAQRSASPSSAPAIDSSSSLSKNPKNAHSP
ncbi:Uncharacterised protein [Mycobacteroides abscessus subsp. abscessus]|nr:Uncharacterised protein [Mycobacteroides abscessus subsp. abscessus]